MKARIDHVVLWVEDALETVRFYEEVLGFAGLRVEEFQKGEVGFPSVRVSDDQILDLMPRRMAPAVDMMTSRDGSAGHAVNHVCFSMTRAEYDALRERLTRAGTPPERTMTDSFGARGLAPEAFYFADPDGNVLEARYYRE